MPQYMKVCNSREYNTFLKRRGQFFTLIEEIKDNWYFTDKQKQGAPKIYSDSLIILIHTIKYLLKFPLRQIQGFFEDYVKDETMFKVPSYSQICRRFKQLDLEINDYRKDNPCLNGLEIMVDSSSINIYHSSTGHEKQNSKYRKYRHYDQTRKIHVAIDNETRMIVSMDYSTSRKRDYSLFPELIENIEGKIEKIYADRAYDKYRCYYAAYIKNAKTIIPPISKAAKQKKGKEKEHLLDRDKAIDYIRQYKDYNAGIKEWKKNNSYGKRSRVEGFFSRFKRICGFHLINKLEKSRKNELIIKVNNLNRFTNIGMPIFKLAP